MKLNAKLVMIMLSLLVIAVCALFVLNQYSQNVLVDEIRENSKEVSKAIQISVADLTSETELSSGLKDYIKSAKNRGITEINIVNKDGEIINSSVPSNVGKRHDVGKLVKGLEGSQSQTANKRTTVDSSRYYDLVVPVIVGDEQLGSVHVNLLLDNIRTIQHKNFIQRLAATAFVFMLGIVLIIFLARRYTKPIQRIVEGVKKVSSGDLSVAFPVESRDEIGELAANFNEMVEKLRERELLERKLSEAEHLSKVGQLSSGIAHEIRNPLNYINLAVDHLREEVIRSSPSTQHRELEALIDKIKEEVRRVNYMVLNFMSYGRPLKIKAVPVSYGKLLERVLPLLREKMEEQGITMVTEIPPDLPLLEADPELLRNCLLNLITNAAHSMPEGGRIDLGASFEPGTGLFRLTVADEGGGISPEDIPKICQPYFTTREAGVGLGLAISERVVKEHGGSLEVESVVGKGSIFTIVLKQGVSPS